MAGFNLRALGLLASMNYTPGGANPNIFTYGTTDALGTVLASGYFNQARDKGKIKAGDLVLGVANGTPFALKFATVPASGAVTTAVAGLDGGSGVTGEQDAITHLTDNSGGSASNTLGAITAGAEYAQADMTAVKNAIASLAAKIEALHSALEDANILKEPS